MQFGQSSSKVIWINYLSFESVSIRHIRQGEKTKQNIQQWSKKRNRMRGDMSGTQLRLRSNFQSKKLFCFPVGHPLLKRPLFYMCVFILLWTICLKRLILKHHAQFNPGVSTSSNLHYLVLRDNRITGLGVN